MVKEKNKSLIYFIKDNIAIQTFVVMCIVNLLGVIFIHSWPDTHKVCLFLLCYAGLFFSIGGITGYIEFKKHKKERRDEIN